MRYYISSVWQGYEVVQEDDFGKHWYLQKVYRGVPYWVNDYLYSRKYSLRTAMKHLKELEGKG